MRPNAHYFPYRLIRSLSKSAPFLCPVFHILLNNPWYFENYRKYRYDMPLFTLMARLRVRFVVFVGIAVTMVVLLFNMNTEFMVSQEEVVRFYMTPEFELVPQDENWKLLIDLDCFNRLSKNLPCQAPLQVASFSNTSVSSHFSRVYRLSRDTTHDFTTFTPLNATHPTRLIVNFEFWKPKEIGLVNGEQVEVAVPDDLDAFMRKWHKSEAIECTGIGAKNRLFWDARRVLPLRVVKEVMAPFRDFCDRNNRTAFITSGSLLGWYRECSIIPHTTDIDFGLMISNYSREFEHLLDRNYELFWALGDGNTSMELSFHVGNVKTDLFFLFDYNSTHSYFSGMLVSARKELFWIYPKIDRICAGNLLGSLMYVPCNTEEFLRADYGPDWMVDSPSRKYYFDKSGKNIMPGKTFTKQQWRHVYRQLRGYKNHSS